MKMGGALDETYGATKYWVSWWITMVVTCSIGMLVGALAEITVTGNDVDLITSEVVSCWTTLTYELGKAKITCGVGWTGKVDGTTDTTWGGI
jgi:hypothetical protein